MPQLYKAEVMVLVEAQDFVVACQILSPCTVLLHCSAALSIWTYPLPEFPILYCPFCRNDIGGYTIQKFNLVNNLIVLLSLIFSDILLQ